MIEKKQPAIGNSMGPGMSLYVLNGKFENFLSLMPNKVISTGRVNICEYILI